VRRRNIAKRKGRHTGAGKRTGTRDARFPSKTLWVRKMRVLRRLLKKYRESNKIDKHLFHTLYQKRLAASVLNCGKRKVWLDPNETQEIHNANSRQNFRQLIKDNYVIKRKDTVHSRFRVRRRNIAKRKGRHTGAGKRTGTRDARFPSKVLWVRKMRVLRRLLKKYRESNKIDKHLFHTLYAKAKGGEFKNKRVLMEHIHSAKAEQIRENALRQQAEMRRFKARAKKAKREGADEEEITALRAQVSDIEQAKALRIKKKAKKQNKAPSDSFFAKAIHTKYLRDGQKSS
jgi:large subunit ribosomal protein L19e